MFLPRINLLHLMVSEILPRQNFKGQGHYGKVKGQTRSHHDDAHLQTLTNVLTKYQLPTPYGFFLFIYLFIWGFTLLSTIYRSYHDG